MPTLLRTISWMRGVGIVFHATKMMSSNPSI